MLKKVIKRMIVLTSPLVVAFLAVFFERRYLSGRFFENQFDGYSWALRAIWQRNILRLAKPLPFPAALTCHVSRGENVHFHPDDINNFQSGGTYFQNFKGTIKLGRGCYIAPNVGIITTNHDVMNLDKHQPSKDVFIGEKCWIGMNSVILPGVTLGTRTIVAAGSVVTKSFPNGHCMIAGTPAKVIKVLDEIFQGRSAKRE